MRTRTTTSDSDSDGGRADQRGGDDPRGLEDRRGLEARAFESPELLAAAAGREAMAWRRAAARGDWGGSDCGCPSAQRGAAADAFTDARGPAPAPDASPAVPPGLAPSPEPDAAPLGPLAPTCVPYPLGKTRTNDNFIFLREILRQDGSAPADPVQAGTCLATWLANTAAGMPPPDGAPFSTLVIDQRVELTQPIVIPPRMTIRGVGPRGAAVLSFGGLVANTAAITFMPAAPGDPDAGIEPAPSYSTLSDLTIEYASPPGDAAIIGLSADVLGTIVYLQRLTLRNWDIAFATVGYFPLVQECTFENNVIGVDVRTNGNALRIEGCAFTGNSGNAVNLNSPGTGIVSPSVDANSVLVTRCTFSGNGLGVYVDRHQGARIIGNAFVGNTGGGIYVTSNAREARIVGNFFDGGDRFAFEDGDMIARVSTHHHQWGFNTAVGLPGQQDPDPESLGVELIWSAVIVDIEEM